MSRPIRVVRAGLDHDTGTRNENHWANADGLSPNATFDVAARVKVRERGRYECLNNSYARGIVLTASNDLIGTGPRPQIATEDRDFAAIVEEEWAAWSEEVDLADKLSVLHRARLESGECFASFVTNDSLESVVKLDLNLIEADRVTSQDSPASLADTGKIDVDGIEIDSNTGRVLRYRVLRYHPGETGIFTAQQAMAFDWVTPENMIHWFRVDRPGQSRGIPDLAPSLHLFAQLRRFTLATLDAAEVAADVAGVIYTDSPPNGETDEVQALDPIELESRSFLTMPAGWRMEQVDAKHPTTTYGDFKKEILNEAARCIHMPFNVAALNSSGYNYSSGRLDHQVYFKALRNERRRLELQVLRRLFRRFLEELVRAHPKLVGRAATGFKLSWIWDGWEHVDPQKEANAEDVRLKNFTRTYAEVCAREGKDWESHLEQVAREQGRMKELGIVTEAQAKADAEKDKQKQEPDDDE